MSVVKMLEEIGSDSSLMQCKGQQQQLKDLLAREEPNKQWCIILLPAEDENEENATENQPGTDRESQEETVRLH